MWVREKNSLVKCCFDFQLIINFWKFNQEPRTTKQTLRRALLEGWAGSEVMNWAHTELWWWTERRSWWWGVSVGAWACTAASPPQTSWEQTAQVLRGVLKTPVRRPSAQQGGCGRRAALASLNCGVTCDALSVFCSEQKRVKTAALVPVHTSWWGGRAGTWLAPPGGVFAGGLGRIRTWPLWPVPPVCPAGVWSGRGSGLSE